MVPPVRPGPLVERGRACGAVLAAQPARAGHVVVGHHRRFHWLQGLIGGVPPAYQTQGETLVRGQKTFFWFVFNYLTLECHAQPWGGLGASVWAGWSWKSSLLVLLCYFHVAG